MSEEPAGYLHPAYAASLSDFGRPRLLARSGGWILERAIPRSPYRDALGCYPLLCCLDWRALGADLDELQEDLVSVAAVSDPWGAYDLGTLHSAFTHVIPFKEHLTVDLTEDPRQFVSRHHQRNVRFAHARVRVEFCDDLTRDVDDWDRLYAGLLAHRGIQDLRAFSRRAFALQLAVPGMIGWRAVRHEETVAMLLCSVQGTVAYYHLGASSPEGYEARASFALFWAALETLGSRGARWWNLGGAAGLVPRADDGLTRFKRGWATGSRTAYFCGRVLHVGRYDELARASGLPPSDFFPRYRAAPFE